jgi:hypothetical protein|tara:strand:+ start:1926 stop:2285 length:360 start_codon:yes stop_codon:yes gene_type:complete
MASKSLTVKEKRSTAIAGIIGVVLLLAKFFPGVYGNLVGRVSQTTNMDASRTSEIINGVILLSIGVVWSMVSKTLSYVPFYRSAWMISGYALIVIGGLLITGYNPFKDSDQFDLTGYQA